MNAGQGQPVMRAGFVCALGCLLAVGLPARAGAETLRVAYVQPRGFFDSAVLGRIEAPLPLGQVKGLVAAGELYTASQSQTTSTTVAFYLMLRNYPFATALISPFVAAGVGVHAIRSRRTIDGIGTLSGTESAAKGHFWAGLRGPSIEGIHPFLETRWTVPSKYVFDYVALGVGL